jgi:uncharacterized protein (DUF362 family)
VAESLAHLCRVLGWADADRGALGGIVPPGARVVVKPNLVLHANQGPWGIEPLVTDPALVRAVTHEVLRAGASSVVVGDAPIQGCNFDELMDRTGLGNWAKTLAQDEPRFVGVRDFRRTVGTFENGLRVAVENLQPVENFVQFDLGRESLLEPVTDDRGMGRFRVTCYDPRLLHQTHARGVHRYLVAKELMDADLVINLPKLKTHKKAGITCCLKNLVGINGNKEYLPHHRVGSAAQGGDCYERSSVIRRSIEYLLDRQNMTSSPSTARALHQLIRQLHRLARLTGQSADTEGSWSGNDTVWRMCLDLNRILLYGSTDASIGADVQRRVLHVVDAVVAGHGNGPLSPEPLDLGLLLGGDSAPAVDWVAATLLAYDPSRIALTRQAFADDQRPLASFGANEVELVGDLGTGPASSVLAARDDLPVVKHPEGWRDASTAGLAREARSTLEVLPE